MWDLSGLGEPWAKIRAQYNVPGGMGIVDAVDHIVAESARRVLTKGTRTPQPAASLHAWRDPA